MKIGLGKMKETMQAYHFFSPNELAPATRAKVGEEQAEEVVSGCYQRFNEFHKLILNGYDY